MHTRHHNRGRRVGEHAIVCGGSMTGLLAAGLLSRHFERVTLVERDRLADGPHPRKGVPQAAHNHTLLTRGMDIITRIFPDYEQALAAAGSRRLDFSGDIATFMAGTWLMQAASGLSYHAQTRSLLEWVLRRQVQSLPNVSTLDGRDIRGYATTANGATITGVELRDVASEREEVLAAELVVDATGRGSRTPQWLAALGYPRVEETRITVDAAYATLLFDRPADFHPGWEALAIGPSLPRLRRLGALSPVEGDRWLVSLGGWKGDHPPTDRAGFLAFARGLAQPHLYEAIRDAEPLGPAAFYRFSNNQRRHYERMRRFPAGLAVVGDAFCSFNPFYGQGITTGALQVEALGQCLAGGLPEVARSYRRLASQALDVPWSMAIGGDLRLPDVEGKRAPGSGLLSWYVDRFQRLGSRDAEALRTFVRVVHMCEPPSAILSPRWIWQVLTARGLEDPTPGPGPQRRPVERRHAS